MKTKLLLLLNLIIVLTACQKKEVLPKSEISDPVFYLDAKVNGNPIVIQAGEAGYYMHSSVNQDTNNIYVFKGDLNGTCNSSCGYSLSVMINDCKVSDEGGLVQVDSALKPGIYNLLNKSAFPTDQQINFIPKEEFSSSNAYNWQIVNDKGVVLTSNTYSFTTNLKLATQYTVNYQFEDASGVCSGKHSNVYKPGNAFRTWMNVNIKETVVSLTAATDEAGTYTYNWDLGDGSTATGKDVQHQYAMASKYIVKLTTTDSKNNVSVCYYSVNTLPGACETNFTARFMPIDYSMVLQTIAFVLRDPNGMVYSSQDAPLLNGSYAEILSVEDYKKNAMGQSTKKIKLRFSCRLKGDTDEVVIDNATAVIAVAY